MKNKLFLLALTTTLALTGCATSVRDNVPATEINAVLGGKPCSAKFPKDFKAGLVKFSAETNGAISLELKDVDARVNPDVITMTGEAYTKMRDADARFTKETISTLGSAGKDIAGSVK